MRKNDKDFGPKIMNEMVGTQTTFFDEKNGGRKSADEKMSDKKNVRRKNVRNHVKQYTIP